jgi:hypothetical protein
MFDFFFVCVYYLIHAYTYIHTHTHTYIHIHMSLPSTTMCMNIYIQEYKITTLSVSVLICVSIYLYFFIFTNGHRLIYTYFCSMVMLSINLFFLCHFRITIQCITMLINEKELDDYQRKGLNPSKVDLK